MPLGCPVLLAIAQPQTRQMHSKIAIWTSIMLNKAEKVQENCLHCLQRRSQSPPIGRAPVSISGRANSRQPTARACLDQMNLISVVSCPRLPAPGSSAADRQCLPISWVALLCKRAPRPHEIDDVAQMRLPCRANVHDRRLGVATGQNISHRALTFLFASATS
jgi:hypothetical protein